MNPLVLLSLNLERNLHLLSHLISGSFVVETIELGSLKRTLRKEEVRVVV